MAGLQWVQAAGDDGLASDVDGAVAAVVLGNSGGDGEDERDEGTQIVVASMLKGVGVEQREAAALRGSGGSGVVVELVMVVAGPRGASDKARRRVASSGVTSSTLGVSSCDSDEWLEQSAAPARSVGRRGGYSGAFLRGKKVQRDRVDHGEDNRK